MYKLDHHSNDMENGNGKLSQKCFNEQVSYSSASFVEPTCLQVTTACKLTYATRQEQFFKKRVKIGQFSLSSLVKILLVRQIFIIYL
jgi:hypothetical protein